MEMLARLTDLSQTELLLVAGICFMAGLVRGFSGFGLSAVVMAGAVLILPPVQLLPVLWFLEMASSLIMMKGGFADADLGVSKGLIIGAGIGLPVGLLLTISLPVEASKIFALCLLIALALTQLAKIRMPFLATTPGLYGSGLGAGMITGISGAGGMFIALYSLARQLPARVMRGTLSIYLLGAGILGLASHVAIGTLDLTAAYRGAALVPPTLAGIVAGRALFVPRFEPLYKPVCLSLMIGLASIGLIRTAL